MGFFISSYLYANACELCNIPVSLQRMNPTSTSVMYTCLWSYWLAPGISGIPNEDGKRFLFRKNRLLQFKQLLPCWSFGNKNRKIQKKKIFWDLGTKILCYAKCSFIVICFRAQNKGENVKPRDVTSHLRYFDDAIKFGLRKKMFLVSNLRYFSK